MLILEHARRPCSHFQQQNEFRLGQSEDRLNKPKPIAPRERFCVTHLGPHAAAQILVHKKRPNVLEIKTTAYEFVEFATPAFVLATAHNQCADSTNS